MSSFRDKIKFATPTTQKSKQQSQHSFTSFDETWLKINFVGGQSQLCPIKLNCSWAVPNITSRPPELSCKWFNKTQNSMSIIDQVNGSYYQPCLQDVGTIIHVQCMPQLQGIQYEGMPIIKQIGPIKIDPQTQQQANDLLEANKATFSVKIKNHEHETIYHQGLIKIQKGNFRLISKLTDPQKQIVNLEICYNSPIFKCFRNKSKQLQIILKNDLKNDNIALQVSNNKIRDILLLLVKLIAVKNSQIQQNKLQYQTNMAKVENQLQENNISEEQIVSEQKILLTTDSISQRKQQNFDQKVYEKNQNIQKNQNLQNTKNTQKQQSQQENKSSKKSQVSDEELRYEDQNDRKNYKQIKTSQIKSSEDLSTIMSPSIRKSNYKIQKTLITPVNNKHNALQILQIGDLKKQLRVQEGEILQLKKTIAEKNQKIQSLHQQITHMKQRQANLSCNFFQLEQQIKKTKENSQKFSQQVSYYKNQNRILKCDLQNSSKKNKSLSQQIDELTVKLSPFLHETEQEHEEQVQTYIQIKQKYQNQIKLREQIQAKYQYMKDQNIKMQQKMNQIKDTLDKIENQKNFYKKKYENISQQFQSQHDNIHQPITSSPVSQVKLIKEKSLLQTKNSGQYSRIENEQKMEQASIYEQLNKLQKQTLELKRHLKQTIQQNNFLRSINAVGTKDKKSSSSKTTLKLELVQMKKIVNRLTEAVTQKDMALDNIKIVNKDISEKLLQATKKLNEYQSLVSLEQHNLKHGHSFG